MKSGFCAVVLVLAAGLPVAAQTIGPEVIFTEVATAPTAKREVPGLGAGVNFESTSAGLALDRPFASPNGQYMAIKFSSSLATTDDDGILFYSAGTGWTVVARENTTTPFDATRPWGVFDNRISLNNSGSFAFANNIGGASLTDDELISKYTLVAGVPTWNSNPYRENDAAADAGVTSFIPTGSKYGTDVNSPQILADGSVCANLDLFNDATVTPPSNANNNGCLYRSGVALQREQLTSPIGQTVFWDLFDADQFLLSADGSTWIATGNDENNTAPALDQITVVNNTVVIREGSIITGLATACDATATDAVTITANGDWFARGNNTDIDEDWVVRNGTVIACRKAGHPANTVTGGSELWGNTDFADTFFVCCGNAVGDWVVGGVTNNPINSNGVLVVNHGGAATVALREGDPLDLNDNGLFDDGAFVRTFGNDDVVLTDDGWLYVAITVTSDQSLGNAGPDIGDALIKVRVFTPSVGCYANCDGSTSQPLLTANDFQCFLNAFASSESYANCDGSTATPTLTANDFQCFLNTYAAGCS